MHEHLTAGITHPETVNPSRDSNSASRAFGTVRKCDGVLYEDASTNF
ncbi:hypothetical protein HMPREF1588_02161 [Escherichia coli 110957]|nr:hypothetical protein HMPREF1588_02161 [Escherichia coli 110957]ESE09543.1 hypothetical protein HMPREF1616_01032 [Escherichia coli 908658]